MLIQNIFHSRNGRNIVSVHNFSAELVWAWTASASRSSRSEIRFSAPKSEAWLQMTRIEEEEEMIVMSGCQRRGGEVRSHPGKVLTLS